MNMVGAYNREISMRKARRKKRIDEKVCGWGSGNYYDNLHQYSKNKIHCSCPMCSAKTRNKGKRRYKKGNYDLSLNYKHSDMLKILAMEEQLLE
jgi:hypothetical protein